MAIRIGLSDIEETLQRIEVEFADDGEFYLYAEGEDFDLVCLGRTMFDCVVNFHRRLGFLIKEARGEGYGGDSE